MVVLSGFVLLLLTGAAEATDDPRTSEQRVRAQELLDQGSALYDKGAYVDALAKFTEAYALYPSPKLCFNIGQTNRNLDRTLAAMEAFEKVLAHPAEVPPDILASARASVADLQKTLGRVGIRCDREGVLVLLDGKLIGTTPLSRPLWASAGQHRLTAMLPEFPRVTQDFFLAPGASIDVQLQLPLASGPPARVPAAPAASAPLSDAAVPQPISPRRSCCLGRKWTWVAAGTSVLLAGGAATFGLLMQSKYDDLNKSCGRKSAEWPGCSPSDLQSLDELKDAANVLWIAAGLTAMTAGVLFVVEGRSWSIAPMAGGATGVLGSARF